MDPDEGLVTGCEQKRGLPLQIELCHLPNSYVEVPASQNVTLIGKRVFMEIIKLKLGLLGKSLSNKTDVL